FVGASAEGERPVGIQPVADLIEQAPVPVVAAIHGYCLGGGLEIALACDFRIATRDAELGFPEVKLGLLPGGGGTQRAPRLISPGRARWLVLSGERIPAATAEAWGLVEFVVDELEEGIARYVEPLDALSPHALRQIRRLMVDTRDARTDRRASPRFWRSAGRRGQAAEAQFSPGSYGMFSMRANAPPLRWSTARQR